MSVPHLTRPLTLEARQQVADGAGGFVETWVALGRLWAEMVPASGRDAAGAEITLGAVAFRITVRAAVPGAQSRPVPGQRFREGARVFAVLAVTERDVAGRYLSCYAREEVPA